MSKFTEQMKMWTGNFGTEYTDRNTMSLEELEKLYKKRFGMTRTELCNLFIGRLNRNIKILEVGSNIGLQLQVLQKEGFKNLYGIEINKYAIEKSRARIKDVNIIQASAFDIPFKDRYFDLVFTSGVLIHISPSDIRKVLKEIHRCSKKYIYGFEYYADKYTTVKYRGHENLLWKTDFLKLYLNTFGDLKLIKKIFIKYLENDNTNVMFLLKKG